jgi:DNA mismatch endonuclease (patch repair protein)
VRLEFSTTPKRAANMRAIRGINNRSTERRLRAHLARSGCKGWSIRPPNLYGHPDFAFLKRKIAIFVDGCFWHACPKCGHLPASNKNYWRAKIARNRMRDRTVSRTLRAHGYLVVRIRECRLRDSPGNAIRLVLQALDRRSGAKRA